MLPDTVNKHDELYLGGNSSQCRLHQRVSALQIEMCAIRDVAKTLK